MKTHGLILLLALTLVFAVGCDNDEPGSNNANNGGGDAASDATTDTGQDATADTSTDTESDSSDDAESDSSDDAESDGQADQYCPTDTLPGETSVTYEGSTVGNDNLFESNRLEWDDAGDDALLYVVPEAGTYEFGLNDGLTDNGGCGVSVFNNADGNDSFHSPSTCPADGETTQLPDAYFVAGEGFSDTADLTADQELLVLVSCATWSSPDKEVEYTLTIDKQ
jgi:hypothetical protein